MTDPNSLLLYKAIRSPPRVCVMITKSLKLLVSFTFSVFLLQTGIAVAASYGNIQIINSSVYSVTLSLGGTQNKGLATTESTSISRKNLRWGDNGTQRGALTVTTPFNDKAYRYSLDLSTPVSRDVHIEIYNTFIVIISGNSQLILKPS